MSGAVSFKLTGDAALDAKFAALPGKMQKQILRDALRPAAKILQSEVVRIVPRRTGLLARSFKVRAGKRTRKDLVRFNVQTRAGDYKGATYYGAFLEYGKLSGSRKDLAPRKRIVGKHYFKIARAAAEQRVRETAIKLIKEGLERVAGATSG